MDIIEKRFLKVKWTNTARKVVLWTLIGLLDALKDDDEDDTPTQAFSSENAKQLKKILNEFYVEQVYFFL